MFPGICFSLHKWIFLPLPVSENKSWWCVYLLSHCLLHSHGCAALSLSLDDLGYLGRLYSVWTDWNIMTSLGKYTCTLRGKWHIRPFSVKIVAIRLREFARLQSDCHSRFGHAMAVSQHEWWLSGQLTMLPPSGSLAGTERKMLEWNLPFQSRPSLITDLCLRLN